jgi:hypothetical protein
MAAVAPVGATAFSALAFSTLARSGDLLFKAGQDRGSSRKKEALSSTRSRKSGMPRAQRNPFEFQNLFGPGLSSLL